MHNEQAIATFAEKVAENHRQTERLDHLNENWDILEPGRQSSSYH